MMIRSTTMHSQVLEVFLDHSDNSYPTFCVTFCGLGDNSSICVHVG